MKEVTSIIIDILMIGLILLQFAVLISMLHSTRKRSELEKQFWKEQTDRMNEVYETLKEQIFFIEDSKEALEDARKEQAEGNTIPKERIK